jgi:hypothetical protein
MPQNALETIMQMLIAGRSKYALMDGEGMRYRKALIRHYRFITGHEKPTIRMMSELPGGGALFSSRRCSTIASNLSSKGLARLQAFRNSSGM